MAGQNINIPNVEEATSMQTKQTNALSGMVSDIQKSVAALKSVDTSMTGHLGETAVDYVTSMADLLERADSINQESQKQFKSFVQALDEVNNTQMRL